MDGGEQSLKTHWSLEPMEQAHHQFVNKSGRIHAMVVKSRIALEIYCATPKFSC